MIGPMVSGLPCGAVQRQTRDLHQRHERARRRVGGGCEESSRMQGPWRSPPWRAVPAARTPCVRLLRPRRRERARGSASFFRGYSRATVSGLDLGGIPALQVLQNKNNEPTHTLYAADRGQHCKFPVKFLVVDSGGLATRRRPTGGQAGPPVCARRATRAQTAFSTLMNLRFVTICVEVEVPI